MNEALKDLTTVLLAIVGLAVFAVLVSKKSNTAGVVSAGSGGFVQALEAAQSSITGWAPSSATMARSAASGFYGLPELGAGYNSGY